MSNRLFSGTGKTMNLKSFAYPQGKTYLYWCWISGIFAVLLAFMGAVMALSGHWWDFSFDVAIGLLNAFSCGTNYANYQKWKQSQTVENNP